jgi:glycosyltransferase involved in cell wall biosynthesis
MKIILATGIYPPDIGGPSMYTYSLAEELVAQGHAVTVITYESPYQRSHTVSRLWQVIDVPRGGWVIRWFRFAKALRTYAKNADIVYAFSSVSCGVPVFLARLRHPKKILRLGGDFFWERYTDHGGMKSLREWYASWHWSSIFGFFMKHHLLTSFDAIVFSTHFQQKIYEKYYRTLPVHRVIENSLLPGLPLPHVAHDPFRFLFMGRFVAFKNISSLVLALAKIPKATLTLTGEGPTSLALVDLVSELSLNDRITFVSPVHGDRKY